MLNYGGSYEERRLGADEKGKKNARNFTFFSFVVNIVQRLTMISEASWIRLKVSWDESSIISCDRILAVDTTVKWRT